MTNKQRRANGRKTFTAYCDLQKLDPIERRQHYTATDLITDVLHYAVSRGWDADTILASAQNHLEAETTRKIESCPKCGDYVTRGNAFVDEGEGDESGRTFYYCSEHCRETH